MPGKEHCHEICRHHCRVRPLPQRARLAAGAGAGAGGAACGGGHELRADPAGSAAAAAGKRAGARRAGVRGRPRVCLAGPLGLRGGGGLCTGRGASAGGHRVRRPGVRGRDPGRCPAAGNRPGAEQCGLPRGTEAAAGRRGAQLCGGPAGGGGGPLPRHRPGGPAGPAQQQPGGGVLPGHPGAASCP